MLRIIPFFFITFFAGLNCLAQVEWAVEVLQVSSQYSAKEWSADQVLGAPNVLPSYGSSPVAWSPRRSNEGTEFIMVRFENPIHARQVVIAENEHPGAISAITLYDEGNKGHRVYENKDPGPAGLPGRLFSTTFKKTRYKVVSARIELNTAAVDGFQQIDAIGICGDTEPVNVQVKTAGVDFLSRPQNMGRNINSTVSELNPIIAPDGKTLYFIRKGHPENIGGDADDIWFSTLDEESKNWSAAKNIGPPLNIPGYNYMNSISPDGNRIFLAGQYEHGGEEELYFAQRTSNGWSEPKRIIIDDYYNDAEYKSFCLGVDGKTMLLSLQREDSRGMKDLYVSFLQNNGTWSAPKSLGSAINTAGDEVTPFLAADGKTLYFSSNGHRGYGNNDIFIARRLDDTWTRWSEPLNMGPVINTSDWDAYYSVAASGEWAFYTSYTNSVGRADIFRIQLEELQKPDIVSLISGKVLDAHTSEPVEATIRYLLDPSEEEIGQGQSSPTSGEYQVVLPADDQYILYAEASGYYPVIENIDLEGQEEYREMERNLYLYPVKAGEVIPLDNIFFAANETILEEASFAELNRVAAFLKANQSVKIEIGGHTNNQCSESYCIELSKNRAKAVADYLKKQGVTRGQVLFEGYGSKKPIDTNSTEEGRKRNQRVEFTILEAG